MRRSVNPAATQLGQNRGKIGESTALVGRYRSVLLGIYHIPIPKENSVSIFGIKTLAGAPQKIGGRPHFLRRGGLGPLFVHT